MARVLMMTSTLPRSQQDTTIAHFVFDLAKELAHNHDHEIRILAPHMPNTPTYEVWDGVEIVRFRYFVPGFETLAQGGIMSRVKKNPGYVLMAVFFMTSLIIHTFVHILRFRPNRIHAHWVFPSGFVAWLVTRMLRTPYMVTSHGSDATQLTKVPTAKAETQSRAAQIRAFVHKGVMTVFSPLFRTVNTVCIRHASMVTAVSNGIAQKLQEKVPNKPISIIPMGIRSEFFVPPQGLRTRQLISVGRLDMDKGFQDVIRVLPQLPEEIRYTIVGEGNARQELSDLAAELGVSERVSLVGSKSASEIRALFDASALFVHPSRHEGFGLVVVEAMASRIPVMTSDIAALQVHTQEGRGISLNTQDTIVFGEAITRALQEHQDQGIEQAYQYSVQYRWDTVAQEFDILYQELSQ